MLKVRLRFEKTGPARYISHLDLMRTFQRAFRRAGLPLAYSEGFNPHPYLSVARPLPVGVDSVCELLDFGLNENSEFEIRNSELETLPGRINAALPLGLKVTEAYPATRKCQEIAWAVYWMELEWEEAVSEGGLQALRSLLDGRPLPVVRKSKKGMVEIDAAALTGGVSIASPDERRVVIQAALAAEETSLNPGTLLEALLAAAGEAFMPWARAAVTRLELVDDTGKVFR